VLALICAALLGGGAPYGRALMAVGMNGAAAPLMKDAGWRGAAQYRAGDFDAAATQFNAATDVYNLGLAETQRGNYAAALEAFDLAAAQGHPDARANFDVVAAYYAGLGIEAEALALFGKRKEGATADSSIARGNARAAGTGSEVTNTNTMLGLAQLDSRGRLGVRRVFDDKFIVADDRWLAQLGDVPGEFMAERIKQEHRRRVKAGISPAPPETEEDRR
jgi:Ca-activated chloride channel family protein